MKSNILNQRNSKYAWGAEYNAAIMGGAESRNPPKRRRSKRRCEIGQLKRLQQNLFEKAKIERLG